MELRRAFVVAAFGGALWAANAKPPAKPRGAVRPGFVMKPADTPPPPSIRFPEESFSDLWSTDCSGWLSLASHESLKIHVAKAKGRFTAFAAMRVRPEPGESVDSVLRSIDRKLRAVESYPDWVLPGINESPDGSRYFITVDGLESRVRQPARHYTLTGPYSFEILWFKRTGASTLDVRLDENVDPPSCPVLRGAMATRALGARPYLRMTPRPEILEWLVAEIYLVPKTAWVELHLRLALKPSKLVYELLPENLARSQVEARGRRIFENFVDSRRSDAVREASSEASGTPSTSGVPQAKGT